MNTTQDPSAYYLQGAGNGLWNAQGAMGAPALFSPGATNGMGVAPAAHTNAMVPTMAAPQTWQATAQGLAAAAAPTAAPTPAAYVSPMSRNYTAAIAPNAAASSAAPAPSSYQVAGNTQAPSGYTVSVGQGAGPKAIAPNQATPGAPVTPYNVPQYVMNNMGANGVTFHKWNQLTNSYDQLMPNDFAAMRIPESQVTTVSGDMTAFGQQQAAAVQQAREQNAQQAADYAAKHPPQQTLPGTAQGSNFDFSSAFSQTPQATAATASAQSAQNSLASQLSTNNYQSGNIAAAGRYGAAQGVNTSGQNQLAIQHAQAADTNQNFAALGNAMQAASANATNTTSAQASADVTAINDDVQALTAQLNTLDASTRARAQGQLTNLQSMINRYQQAVAQAGADSALAKSIFTGILAAGAAVAVVATGGTAAVALGAAGAASAAGKAA